MGNSFIEVVSPLREGTPAGRFLERRGGDTGYLITLQIGDYRATKTRIDRLGIRTTFDVSSPANKGVHLYPKDVPGAIVDLRWNERDELPDGPWLPAGPDWMQHRRTEVVSSMLAAEIQTEDPTDLARTWGGALDREPRQDTERCQIIEVDDACIRFAEATDGRGQGIGGLDIAVTDIGFVRRAAEERGCLVNQDTVMICGVRFRPRPAPDARS